MDHARGSQGFELLGDFGLKGGRHFLAQGEILAQALNDAQRERDLPGRRLELQAAVVLGREIGVHLTADVHRCLAALAMRGRSA
jgi:hypothetical protein